MRGGLREREGEREDARERKRRSAFVHACVLQANTNSTNAHPNQQTIKRMSKATKIKCQKFKLVESVSTQCSATLSRFNTVVVRIITAGCSVVTWSAVTNTVMHAHTTITIAAVSIHCEAR